MSFSKDTIFKLQDYTECKGRGEKKKHGLEEPFKKDASFGIFPTSVFFHYAIIKGERRQNTLKKTISIRRNAIIVEWEDMEEKEMHRSQVSGKLFAKVKMYTVVSMTWQWRTCTKSDQRWQVIGGNVSLPRQVITFVLLRVASPNNLKPSWENGIFCCLPLWPLLSA